MAAESSLMLRVEGMHCASCVDRVERLLARQPGVLSATVNLAAERARLVLAAPVELAALDAALSPAGFGVAAVERAPEVEALQAAAERRRLARAALLAGALALPMLVVEMGGHALGLMPPAWFGWVEAVLASAAMAGPARRILRAGWASLRMLAPDMNALALLGMGAAWAASMAALLVPGIFPPGAAHLYFESIGVIAALLLAGRWLEAGARRRSFAAIRALATLAPRAARLVQPDGSLREVPPQALLPGDAVRLLPGERVPADGIVIDGTGAVDESMLTGEAVPVTKAPGDRLVGGTVNGTGSLTFRVEAVGDATVLAQMLALVEAAQASKLPVEALVTQVTRRFVPAVLALALLAFAGWLLLAPQAGLAAALVAAVSVLIVACPCAMGLAVPVAIAVASGRAARHGLLFREAAALQRLAEVRHVAFDKTGTLTEGRPVLRSVLAVQPGSEPRLLALAAALERHSEHPLAQAVVAAAEAAGAVPTAVAAVQAVPGGGIAGEVEGHALVVGTAALLAERGVAMPEPWAARAAELQAQGDSVFCVAIDGSLAGMLAAGDPLRAGAAEALAALRAAGLGVSVLSGDAPRTVAAVAAQLGLPAGCAQGGLLPQDKAAALAALPPAVFVGDGINDAPALASAAVGIAMARGSEIAVSAADIVAVAGDPRAVPQALQLARTAMRIIRQNLFWAFGYNAAMLPLAMAGALTPAWAAAAMALSSLFVLGNALRLAPRR